MAVFVRSVAFTVLALLVIQLSAEFVDYNSEKPKSDSTYMTDFVKLFLNKLSQTDSVEDGALAGVPSSEEYDYFDDNRESREEKVIYQRCGVSTEEVRLGHEYVPYKIEQKTCERMSTGNNVTGPVCTSHVCSTRMRSIRVFKKMAGSCWERKIIEIPDGCKCIEE